MVQELNSELIKRSRYIAIAIIIGSVCVTVACLVGWACDIDSLKTLMMGPRMLLRSSNALALLLCAISLLLINFSDRRAILVVPGIALATLVLLSSGALFAEGIANLDFDLAFKIYAPNEDSAGITFPGPMAANIALNFILLSLALATSMLNGPKSQWVWQSFSIISMLLALFVFFGFLCGVDTLCTMFGCVRMPFTISALFTLLSAGTLCANPQCESMQIFVTDSLGGRIARRFLTFIIAIPVSLVIRDLGVSAGLYDAAFGWAVFGILVFAALIAVVIWSARSLDLLDSKRKEAEQKQAESEEKLEKTEMQFTKEMARQIAQNTGTHAALKLRNICLNCTKEYDMALSVCPDDKEELVQIADTSLIGTAFAEKYFITEELGSGGMATVYKARHLFLENKIFAVKILNENIASDSLHVKRFQHEAKTASKLEHPNLIRIHDFGISREGKAYLLMDFIKGKTLQDLLNECKRIDVAQFENIFAQVLDGMEMVHAAGIVHRDIKPGNIMLIEQEDGKENAKIVDFGIAKVGDESEANRLTRTGEVFGSPLYMSPEQWAGKQLDGRADLYSIGCMMYESLAGFSPFERDTIFEVLQAHAFGEVPDIPRSLKVPDRIQAAIKACLAKEREERPASAQALKALMFASSPEAKITSQS